MNPQKHEGQPVTDLDEALLDPKMPDEIREEFGQKMREAKAQGFSNFRLAFHALSASDEQRVEGGVELNTDEVILDRRVHHDDMKDAGDAEKRTDTIYHLIARKTETPPTE